MRQNFTATITEPATGAALFDVECDVVVEIDWPDLEPDPAVRVTSVTVDARTRAAGRWVGKATVDLLDHPDPMLAALGARIKAQAERDRDVCERALDWYGLDYVTRGGQDPDAYWTVAGVKVR